MSLVHTHPHLDVSEFPGTISANCRVVVCVSRFRVLFIDLFHFRSRRCVSEDPRDGEGEDFQELSRLSLDTHRREVTGPVVH